MENSVPHKLRLIRAFGMPPLKRGHRHVASKIQAIEDWAELTRWLAKIQSIVNWAELRISPVQIQPIENWAEPRSVENVQQFSSFAKMPPLKRGHRHVAGIVAVHEELGCARKRQEHSAVLGLCREASRTFCNSWAPRTSIVTLLTVLQSGKAADGAD
jgi:hypothetical protein